MPVCRDTFEPAQKIDDIPDEKYNTQSQQKGLILLPVLTVTDSRDLPGPTWQIDGPLQDLLAYIYTINLLALFSLSFVLRKQLVWLHKIGFFENICLLE